MIILLPNLMARESGLFSHVGPKGALALDPLATGRRWARRIHDL